MHVAALQVLNDGGFEGLGFGQVHDADGRVIESGPLRSAVASGPGDDLVGMFAERTNEQGREDALGADALAQFGQRVLIEAAAGVQRRFDQGFEREVAVFTLKFNG